MSEEFCNQIIGNGGPMKLPSQQLKVCDNIDPLLDFLPEKAKANKTRFSESKFQYLSLSLSPKKTYNHFEKALGTFFCFFLWDLNKQINQKNYIHSKKKPMPCVYIQFFVFFSSGPEHTNKPTSSSFVFLTHHHISTRTQIHGPCFFLKPN